MKAASFDPSKLLTLYFRIARAGSIKFIFTDEDGDPFDISGIDFELPIKRFKDGDDVIKLTLSDGLTIGGAGSNELLAEVDEVDTAQDPGTYFWQLYNVTGKKTWLNGDAPFHNGKFDSPDHVEEQITITTEAAAITVTIAAGGGASSVEHFRGAHDASTDLLPDSGGSGTAGAVQAADEWYFSVGGTFAGFFYPAGTIAKALVDTPGQTVTSWRLI